MYDISPYVLHPFIKYHNNRIIYIHSLGFDAVDIMCLLTGVRGSFPFKTASMFFIDNSSKPICL